MDQITALAVAKLIAPKNVDLPIGSTRIKKTLTIEVDATVNKFADEEYTPTVSIPLKATMAVLLQRMGFQRDRAMELLTEAMTEALKMEKMGEDEIAKLSANVDEAMERVAAVTAALPKAIRKGKTTIKGTIKELIVA